MKVKEGEKHFTSSVWLITKKIPKKVLLIFHNKFNLWIQPGGHIERFENPVDAAIRETLEETGIDISFLREEVIKSHESNFLPVPEFILEEKIPPHKDQPRHFHIDFMYVVRVDEESFQENKKETNGIGFFTKEEALTLKMYKDSIHIINKLLK